MTQEKLRNLGFLLCLAVFGVVLFSMYGAFRGAIENGNWVAFLGGIVLGAAMVAFLLIVMIVPDRRKTGWVAAITNVNAKYLFFALIIAWIAAMGLLASLQLPSTTVGGPALVGLFVGIFIFMGFIWAVIGE
jgi:hypothetical protein